MAQSKDERVAYFNGKIVAESEVLVPFRDRGFIFGDAAFDMTRTFGHRIYKLEEHLERFYRSMRYLQLDPRLELAELASITEEVLERNLILLDPDDDYWVGQRVSRGGPDGPTVIVECSPLPLAARAHLYRDGVRVVVPALRRVPPNRSARVPRHTTTSTVVADLEAKAVQDDAWPSCSTRTGTSPRASAPISSWSRMARSPRRRRSTCCRASAGRQSWSWPASSTWH